jgi:uncharacterized protein YjiS (DUF1127 family)
MRTVCSAPAMPHSMAGQSWGRERVASLKGWWAAYQSRRAEQAAIAQLWSMSDRELRDIGLTRSEIADAVKGEAARDRAISHRYY